MEEATFFKEVEVGGGGGQWDFYVLLMLLFLW